MPTPRAQSRTQPVLFLVFVLVLCVLSAWLFLQRQLWLPELASVHGADMDREFLVTLTITGIMFVVIQVGLGILAFRFSAARNSTARVQSRAFEKRFAIVAALVVFLVDISLFAFGEAAFSRMFGLDTTNATIVEVTGEQFGWNIRYPGPDGTFGRTDPALIDAALNPIGLDSTDPAAEDDVVRINQMHVPLGRPVTVRLRSKDVIHSFAVPNLRVKQDAVPGMVVDVSFQPTLAGQFEIVCNQICGLGHYRMRAFLVVEADDDFNEWLENEF